MGLHGPCELLELLALPGRQNPHDLILARGLPVFQLSLQILVVAGIIVQYGFELPALLRREIQVLGQAIIGESLSDTRAPVAAGMDAVIHAYAHHERSEDRSGKEHEQQDAVYTRILPRRALRIKHCERDYSW